MYLCACACIIIRIPRRASTAADGDKPKTNLVVLGAYFLAWYALNVGYNIANKQVLAVLPSCPCVVVGRVGRWVLGSWKCPTTCVQL